MFESLSTSTRMSQNNELFYFGLFLRDSDFRYSPESQMKNPSSKIGLLSDKFVYMRRLKWCFRVDYT